MKHPVLVSIQVMALAASGFAIDASVLEQRIWTELRYRTMRSVAMVEPEAKRAWTRLWGTPH